MNLRKAYLIAEDYRGKYSTEDRVEALKILCGTRERLRHATARYRNRTGTIQRLVATMRKLEEI